MNNIVAVEGFSDIRLIGVGKTASVYRATRDGIQYALKVFNPIYDSADHELLISNKLPKPCPGVIEALSASRKLEVRRHNNSTPVSASILIMEYMPEGDLFQKIKSAGKFDEKLARYLFRGLIETIAHIHGQGVVHLDIKPENILFDSEYNLRLGDFGCACTQYFGITDYVGTNGYMAPEIWVKTPFNGQRADIFSAGVVLYIMATGTFPFNNATNGDKLYQTFCNDKTKYWLNPKLKGMSSEFKNLIDGMMERDNTRRLSIEEVMSHVWLKGQVYSAEQVKFYLSSL